MTILDYNDYINRYKQMIYIITVKFGYFFDGLGFLCRGFELIIRMIINLI